MKKVLIKINAFSFYEKKNPIVVKWDEISFPYHFIGKRIAVSYAESRRCLLTAVLIQLLVHLFHPLDIDTRNLVVIHHRQRIILADDAFGGVLYAKRCVPRFVNIPGWKVLQHRQVASDRVTVNRIDFIKGDGNHPFHTRAKLFSGNINGRRKCE